MRDWVFLDWGMGIWNFGLEIGDLELGTGIFGLGIFWIGELRGSCSCLALLSDFYFSGILPAFPKPNVILSNPTIQP